MNTTISTKFLSSIIFILLLTLGITSSSLLAQPFAGGNGTQGDPYQVATATQLDSVRNYTGSGIYFIQTGDIDLNESPYNTGEGWVPIDAFAGSYNGGGYTISNLFINRPSTSNQGLFGSLQGVVNVNAVISNLVLSNGNVTGLSRTGLLAGSSSRGSFSQIRVSGGVVNGAGDEVAGLVGTTFIGSISDVVVTGITVSNSSGNFTAGVVGTTNNVPINRVQITNVIVSGNDRTGGLAGFVNNGSTVNEIAVSGGRVTGTSEVGGLAGRINISSLTNSYSINKVSGSTPGGLVGIIETSSITTSYSASVATGAGAAGLLGLNLNSSGTITNSYFNSDSTSAGNGNGTGLTTAEMEVIAFYTGFDFTNTWYLGSAVQSEFPVLRALHTIPSPSYTFSGGSGTSLDPYRVATAADLDSVRFFTSSYFIQTADIILGASPYNTGEGWSPIDNFTGSYDGGGFSITNLFINRPGNNNTGLFGSVSGATLTKINLSLSGVTGLVNTGGLVGITTGSTSISEIAVSGGSVTGSTDVGGLTGNFAGSITNSYATTKVTGTLNPGGLAGSSSGTITTSYSASAVSGTGAAGLVSSSSGTITNSYFNSDSTSAVTSNGDSLTTAQMEVIAFYAGFDFTNTWYLGSALVTEFPVLRTLHTIPSSSYTFSGGSGTSLDPYRVATAADLDSVRFFASSYFIQTADINLGGFPYNSSPGWNPITNFTGSYNGNGFSITNLFINRPGNNNTGLFGSASGATLTKINLSLSGVTGLVNTGGLVGIATGNTTLDQTVVTGGTVIGSTNVGGLAGNSAGSIVNSYATTNVTGTSSPGGLVGRSSGAITTSYSASTVTGTDAAGLVSSSSGTITNSYYSISNTPAATNYGTGLNNSQISNPGFFTGFDLTSTWIHLNQVMSAPELRIFSSFSPIFAGGSGSQPDPYQIETAAHLDSIRYFLSSNFVQTRDINLDVNPYNTGEGWVPVSSFTGLYDGGGYTISGLMINRPSSSDQGLFGSLNGGVFTNFTLSGGNVTGLSNTGMMAGTFNNSHISRIRISGGTVNGSGNAVGGVVGSVTLGSMSDIEVTGTTVTNNSGSNNTGGAIGITSNIQINRVQVTNVVVSGGTFTGGFAGFVNNSSKVREIAVTRGSVTGVADVGGLAGRLSASSIANSYTITEVTGNDSGGLAGAISFAQVDTTYSASKVSGSGSVGGLVGISDNTTINYSYYNSDSTSASTSNGTGLTTSEMKVIPFYTGFDFTNTWYLGPAIQSEFPVLRTFQSIPSASYAFSGGSGTQQAPYQVATAADLDSVRFFASSYFIQTADINLGSSSYNTGEGWSPINNFTGSYDGNGFSITNLFINRPANANTGLFGSVSGATLTKINLSLSGVTGSSSTGALVGIATGSTSISEIAVSGGSVTGSTDVGGLTGNFAGSIVNSYAITKVTGTLNPGGLAGSSSGSITTSYSASAVSGTGFAGLVSSSSGTITNSYFNSDSTSGGIANGDSLSTAQMRTLSAFTGFNFGTTWFINEGLDFPGLQVFVDLNGAFAGGSGIQIDPYRITTAEHLNNIRLAPSAFYRQTADINLNAAPYNAGNGWSPIYLIGGTYDGAGYTISGLTINTGPVGNAGLFSHVEGATITSLTLSGASIAAGVNTGMLSGSASGSKITGIRVSGGNLSGNGTTMGGLLGVSASDSLSDITITGSSLSLAPGNDLGGLIGNAGGTAISKVQITNVSVSGQSDAGGLAGDLNSGASVSESEVTGGNVQGDFAGGLAGRMSGSSITNSYSTSPVNGTTEAGGAAALVSGGSIVTSYSASVVTGGNPTGLASVVENGGTITNSYFNSDSTSAVTSNGDSLNTAQMRTLSAFTGFDFTTTWFINDGSDFPALLAFVDLTTVFAGGSGTQNDPYQIVTHDQLNRVRLFPAAHFLQTADINLNAAPYNTGNGWLPISAFTGSYNGGRYTISGLTISRSTSDDVGLFGTVQGGSITDLNLSGVTITGRNNTGGLAGLADASAIISRVQVTGGSVSGRINVGGAVGLLSGSLSQSNSTGMLVSGTGSNGLVDTGGLVGELSGSVSDSYVDNTVQGNVWRGGMVGRLTASGTVTTSYSVGEIIGAAGAGGLVGTRDNGGTVTNSFFNNDSTFAGAEAGGTILNTAQMRQQASFTGFDFTNTWFIEEGVDFPKLQTIFVNTGGFAGGTGTQNDPYLVATAHQLNNVRLLPSVYYRQTANINLGAAPYNTGEGWLPVASFTGSYDGGNYTISGLTINRPSANNVGLFGTVSGGSIHNLALAGATITGASNVGALAGLAEATSNISIVKISGGSVSGSADVGGLAGQVNASSVTNSYAVNHVSGTNSGGLAGTLTNGTIATSYYSASAATGNDAAGLVSTNSGGTITNSYYNSDSTAAGNGTGLTTAQMRMASSFTGFDFADTWFQLNDVIFPELRAFSNVSSIFAGGTGIQSDPYQVATATHLDSVRHFPSSYFIQTADINLDAAPYNTGEGWLPVASFSGSYNGGGFTISGLTINRPSANNVGLFGTVSGGSINNLALTGATVTGASNVGALIGLAETTSNISIVKISGGSVNGTSNVGGLAGQLNASSVTNSYAILRVNGTNDSGGLVGTLISGTITTSYSASAATGNNPAGLVSTNSGGTITNSYFNSDSTSAGNGNGTGLSSAQMQTTSVNFSGFNFSTVWVLRSALDSSPQLRALVDYNHAFAGGSGTEADPFRVATAVHLDNVRHLSDFYFIQTADIDLGVAPYNTGEGWTPISILIGTYDGGGHTISNLFINTTDFTNISALISKLNGGTLKNITLINPSVTAPHAAAGIVGSVDFGNNSIINCRVIGGSVTATGSQLASGSAGAIAASFNGELSNSYSAGVTVTAPGNAGGLIGGMSGSITNSYAINRVIGGTNAGGLFANTTFGRPIINSYSASVVTGSGNVGGLFASVILAPTITNSYYNSDSTVTTTNSYGTPLTTAQMRRHASFSGWDFTNTWFMEEGVSFPAFHERKSDELVITGTEGWRMLASPLSARSVGRLLDPLWTQGFTGADATTGSSNLYFWNEATRLWTLPGDTSFTPSTGTGFLMYVYSDDNNDGTPEGFPKRLNQAGTPFGGQRSLDLSYTNTGSSASDGWNLVGNPYPTSINWNAGSGWSRNNMDMTFYVWSDEASNGNGAYLTWNSLGVGTKGDGKIAPWQGFWVKANGANPQIVFTDSVRNTGGVLLKQVPTIIPKLKLNIEGNGLSSETVVMFHKEALEDKDAFDAYKLQSLNIDYLLMGTSVGGGQVMDIQSLPHPEELTELELILEGSDLSGEFTLSWEPEDIPEGWTAELVDTHTGHAYPVTAEGSISFTLDHGAKAKGSRQQAEQKQALASPATPIRPVRKSKAGSSRFVLRVNSQLTTGIETNLDLPTKVELQQNYPNPFNPSTTIAFGIPETGEVTLEVFDVLGRKVATLLDGEHKTAGRYTIRFDASRLASGMYIYRLQNGNKVITKKLTLIK